ncbi:hypothetical protein [Corynebacterium accolens]|uniref:hypothetical protein n=1 Tax=Corynebacterium accolens TaxID=38284 RepID=UPI0032B7CF77
MAFFRGLGVIVLDGTIVGVALPSIITDLQLNLTQAQRVNSLYAVLLAALLLSTGKIADTWGRKRAFLRRANDIRGRQRFGGIFYLRRYADLRAQYKLSAPRSSCRPRFPR